MTKNSYYKFKVAFIAGIIGVCSFPPLNIWPMGLISTAILFELQRKSKDLKEIAFFSFVYGVSTYLFGCNWFYYSATVFGDLNPALSSVALIIFVIVFALYNSFQGLLMGLLKKLNPNMNFVQIALAFASTIVLVEILRGNTLISFSWLQLGYSQVSSVIANYAVLGSVYLVTFIVAMISCILAELTKSGKTIMTSRLLLAVALTFAVGFFLGNYNWTKFNNNNKTYSLVQGNVSPQTKRNYGHDDVDAAKRFMKTRITPDVMVWENYGRYLDSDPADLILWPETVLPASYHSYKAFVDNLGSIAKKNNSSLLMGLFYEQELGKKHISMLITGESNAVYHKRVLVPFGEYLPYPKMFRYLTDLFDYPVPSKGYPGNYHSPYLINGIEVTPLICGETDYPQLVRNSIISTNSSEIIANIVENSYYGKIMGPYLHLNVARMRAIETGREVLRVASTGITAHISKTGQVLSSLEIDTHGILKGVGSGVTGMTPWLYLGIWPFVCLFITFIIYAVTPMSIFTRESSLEESYGM